jgi:AraC-like DNA-binding protein
MQLRDRVIDLHPGTCLFMRPGGLYLAEQNPNDRLGVSAQHFDLRQSRSGRRPPTNQLPDEVIHLTDIHAARAIMQRIAFLHTRALPLAASRSQHPPTTAEHAASTLMRGLLLDLQFTSHSPVQRQNPTDHLHQQIVTKLLADMAESTQPTPSVRDIAAKAGYSPAHFSRIFHQVMGISPQRYFVEARITRARQLLLETDWSISHIASALGYSDIFFFSRQFKQITGTPPTHLRKPCPLGPPQARR